MGQPSKQSSIDERAANLVVRLDGCDSAELQSEAEAWIEADPRHAVAFAIADARWRTAARVRLREEAREEYTSGSAYDDVPSSDAGLSLRRGAILGRLPRRLQAFTAPQVSRRQAAAAVAVLCGVGWSGWYFALRADRRTTGFGERSIAELADGSTISLNSETSVAIELEPSVRKVWLERGEAYFEISRDQTRPFLVQTPGARIAVLGTKFNVRTRAGVTELAVTEGLVAVTPPGGPSVHVPVNAVATIGPDGISVSRDDLLAVERKVAWSKGFIQFDNESLGDVVAEFNRYRARPIGVADAETARTRITGRFGINESEEFLTALESSFDMKVERSSGQITVSK